MDLSDLPAELVETIAEYLSFEDICACSSVNINWRTAFDIHRVWKRFCTFHPNYFDKQRNKVEYTPSSDRRCASKEKLFKELFVQRNVSRGSYCTTTVKYGSLYIDNVLDVVDDIGNHWLFVSCMEGTFFVHDHKLQVWNMNDDPVLHTCTETPLGKVKRLINSDMKMNQDKFFFIYEKTVLVYEFTYPLYELKCLHKIVLKPLKVFPDDTFFEMRMVTLNNIVLGFLYTSLCNMGPPNVHVWDEKGSLIFNKYYPPFVPESYEQGMCYPSMEMKTNDLDKVVVFYQHFCSILEKRYTITVFNVPLLQYTLRLTLTCKYIVSFDICGNVVSFLYHEIGRNDTTIAKCVNTESGSLLLKVDFNQNGECSFHKLVPGAEDGEMVVVINNTFFLFDVSSKTQINNFKLFGDDMTITMLRKNLLLHESSYNGRVSHDIWNFKTGQRLYSLDFSPDFGFEQHSYSYSFIKKYCSPPKLIAFRNPMLTYPREMKNNEVIVVNFW